MPRFEITAPDGKKYRVFAPEGATEEDAIGYVQQNLHTQPESGGQPDVVLNPVAQTNTTRQHPGATLLDNLKNSFIGGAVRGARDIADGGAQLLTRGLEAVAPAGSDFEKFMQAERQKVEGINQAAEQDYRQNWRNGEDRGLDVGRIGGNIAASIPLAMPFMAAQSAPMLGRVLSGAGAGTVGAAMQPVNDTGEDNPFWEQKAEQAAIGAATGAASPFVSDALAKGFSKIAAKFRGFDPKQGAEELSVKFSQRGIDFNRLSKEMQNSLMKDVETSIKSGGNLDIDALARKADFDSLNIKPTLGQLTREPGQFQFEQNTRGIAGSGDELASRFNTQNKQLIENLNTQRSGAGLDRYGAGNQIIDHLKAIDAARKSGVDNLYGAAREAAGIHAPLNPGNFAQSVNNALDNAMLGDALPGGVRKAINQIATGELPFTIQKAEQIRQAINGQMSQIPGRENVALKIVNDALQNEIDRVGDTLGQQAGDAFKAARSAAAQRFSALDNSAPLKSVVEGAVSPDDFVSKFLIRGKAADVMALRSDLQNNPQLFAETKGQIIDWLKEKALNGSTDEFGKFSQSAYNKALKQIGEAKLKILFQPEEMQHLQRIGRVSAAIQSQPVGAVVNNSGTSQAIANLMGRMSGLPYLKELAINPLMNFRVQGQVNSALNPSAQAFNRPAALPPELIRGFNLPLSVAGYPILKPLLEPQVQGH